METKDLSVIVSLLVALSIASERLVEIIKGLLVWLREVNEDPQQEGWRNSILQVLAVVAGIVTTWLAQPVIRDVVPKSWDSWPGILALGLLASGGSGFWNSILGYVNQVKELKKATTVEKKAGAEAVKMMALDTGAVVKSAANAASSAVLAAEAAKASAQAAELASRMPVPRDAGGPKAPTTGPSDKQT